MLLVRVGYHQLHACQIQRRVLKLHAVGIQENRIAFLAHCGRKLVHDAALHTVVFVLRILPDKSKILICKHIFHPEKAAEHLSGQNLKRSRGGKTGSIRNVSVNNHIKAAVNRMPLLCKGPDHTLRIVGPSRLLRRRQIVQRSADHTELLKIHREKPHHTIGSLSCCRVGSKADCTRKDMSAVVIRMLPDQIHASRCKEKTNSLGISKLLFKCL